MCDPYDRRLGRVKSIGRTNQTDTLVTKDLLFEGVRKLSMLFSGIIDKFGMKHFKTYIQETSGIQAIEDIVNKYIEELNPEK